jgi:hypothetical protein
LGHRCQNILEYFSGPAYPDVGSNQFFTLHLLMTKPTKCVAYAKYVLVMQNMPTGITWIKLSKDIFKYLNLEVYKCETKKITIL